MPVVQTKGKPYVPPLPPGAKPVARRTSQPRRTDRIAIAGLVFWCVPCGMATPTLSSDDDRIEQLLARSVA
jgi:hypothetical protein